LVRPSVLGYLADPVKYREAAEDLFAMVAAGVVVPVGAEYPLAEAARAHADLEARRTTGSVLLVP
jgi:NADPH2:quinone reductase